MYISQWTEKSSVKSDLVQIKSAAFREGPAENYQEVNYFHCIFENKKRAASAVELFKPFKTSIYPFLSIPRLKDSVNDLI